MSQWLAVDSLDEALELTGKMLKPVHPSFWLRLALVAALASGMGVGNLGRVVDSVPQGDGKMPVAAIVVLIGFLFLLGVFFGLLSAVSRFVLVKALITGKLRLREYYDSEGFAGFKLFLLESLLTIAVVCIGLFLAFCIASIALVSPVFAIIAVVAVIIFICMPGVIILMVLASLINDFAVPLSMASDFGLLKALSKVLRLVRLNPVQFAVFWLLDMALGAAAMIVELIVSVPFILAFIGLLFLVGFGAYLGISSADGFDFWAIDQKVMIVMLVCLFLALVVMRYFVSLITLPVVVFLRYFSLVFLQKIARELPILKVSSATNKVKTEEHIRVY
jgi:hypothetical protein